MATRSGRIGEACAWLDEQKLDGLVAFSDGHNSFLESNAVLVFSGLRPMGESAVVLQADGTSTLITTPAWDGERAATLSQTTHVKAVDDLAAALCDHLQSTGLSACKLAVIALNKQRGIVARTVLASLEHKPREENTLAAHIARIRTPEEIASLKKATWIAERGYERLMESARPGIREFELAADIYTYMKGLGAEDNFLLMSASQHNLAVRAAGRRILQEGDIILGEITPCYQSQFVQICRTTVIGPASDLLHEKFFILQEAMQRGMEAAVPGATVAEATIAMNDVFIKAGYGDYCRPPYMRVRGHGLGVTTDRPGDLTDSSQVKFEEGMVFVMHPNQYIPETGYLMCGEPVVISHNGAISMSDSDAKLDVICN
jgi:Xaa-Pro dipeptidase